MTRTAREPEISQDGRGLSSDEREIVEAAGPLVERTAVALGMRWRWLLAKKELIAIGQLAAAEAARSFEPARGSFDAYALPAVRGAMLDALERERQRGRVGFDSSTTDCELNGLSGRPPRSPEQVVTERGEHALAHLTLEAATNELPERDQELIRMHYREGREWKEIAAHFDVNHKTVLRWRDRAMAWLRARLRSLGVDRAARPSWAPTSDGGC